MLSSEQYQQRTACQGLPDLSRYVPASCDREPSGLVHLPKAAREGSRRTKFRVTWQQSTSKVQIGDQLSQAQEENTQRAAQLQRFVSDKNLQKFASAVAEAVRGSYTDSL